MYTLFVVPYTQKGLAESPMLRILLSQLLIHHLCIGISKNYVDIPREYANTPQQTTHPSASTFGLSLQDSECSQWSHTHVNPSESSTTHSSPQIFRDGQLKLGIDGFLLLYMHPVSH
jgi:hypothetical protein